MVTHDDPLSLGICQEISFNKIKPNIISPMIQNTFFEIIGVTRRRDVANRREAGESNIATRMRMMLLGVFLAILALNLCHCLNCNCTNAVCPNVGTLCPNGRVLGDCGCCYVCIRKVSELCGGLHDILGKCKSGLRCVYETAQSTSKLKIGFCEDPNGMA